MIHQHTDNYFELCNQCIEFFSFSAFYKHTSSHIRIFIHLLGVSYIKFFFKYRVIKLVCYIYQLWQQHPLYECEIGIRMSELKDGIDLPEAHSIILEWNTGASITTTVVLNTVT